MCGNIHQAKKTPERGRERESSVPQLPMSYRTDIQALVCDEWKIKRKTKKRPLSTFHGKPRNQIGERYAHFIGASSRAAIRRNICVQRKLPIVARNETERVTKTSLSSRSKNLLVQLIKEGVLNKTAEPSSRESEHGVEDALNATAKKNRPDILFLSLFFPQGGKEKEEDTSFRTSGESKNSWDFQLPPDGQARRNACFMEL